MASTKNVLIFGATGRQGGALVRLLRDNADYNVFAATRNPESASAKKLAAAGNVTCVKANMAEPDSLAPALRESGAQLVFFMTDFWTQKGNSKEMGRKETQDGKNVVDAVKLAVEAGQAVEYVVYASVGDAAEAADNVVHFHSKAHVESYMEEQLGSLAGQGGAFNGYAVVRPAFFIENYDDAANGNPLTKGQLVGFLKPGQKLKHSCSEDTARAVKIFFENQTKYHRTIMEAPIGEWTGLEVTQALSEASGVAHKFKKLPVPRFVMRMLMPDIVFMLVWFEKQGYSGDVAAFRQFLKDEGGYEAYDAQSWFAECKRQWRLPEVEKFPAVVAREEEAARAAAEETAVKAAVTQYFDALGTQDVPTIVEKSYAPDGVFFPHQLPTAKGSDELRAAYTQIFQAIKLDVKLNIESAEVSGDEAVVVTSSLGTVHVNEPNIDVPEANREIFHMHKIDGDWRIQTYMFNKAEAPAAA